MLLRQVRQDVRPEVLLLTQGVKAAVQIHFVGSGQNGAAQQQLFVSGIRVRVRPKAFFTGQHTLLMNHAFSARRLARFRENIRHSAHSTMAVDRVDRIRYGT